MKQEKQMNSLDEKVDAFLSQERIAVAGVSHTSENPANLIYRKLKKTGKTVIPVNPNANSFDGDTGVGMVWMHRSLDMLGGGSVSEEAVEFCRENGIEVIAGACPMMFCKPVDIGHKCMGWIMKVSGRMPT
jgi:predicted CoA-binding protein